jgi:cytoskeleton protein RodZ
VFEIGSTLREARVRRKLTLQQAEEETKVRVKYIQAMENEDFDVMPSPAYVKGFLRTYATYLGLDHEIILEEYHSRFEPHEEHDAFGGSSALRPRRHARRNTLAFVAVVCLLVLTLLWFLGHDSSKKPTATGPSASPTSPTSKPSQSPKPSPSATTVVLTVMADGGATFLEVRKGSPTGELVFRANLVQGRTRSFRNDGPLFVRVDKPALVLMGANGKKPSRPIETTASDYRVTVDGIHKL